ncbi:hypothetical protein [Thalassospira lucentensis]|uniref:DUF4760 domain-containing protein n=1 Tax=Thalassospira lucentensis TaxID=168935 RepID=A0A358HPA5_9PROT|nr:hypothetical protein [Thalassospira lucentensis]HBU97018.1 hypothetical protein [Thalassospira lucentensis]HCW67198.1 hypothetical protein [Thalassospira lucentensis]|tara:strand:- start:537 stop:1166 length:630 start_codon:yes stop_codon:yes gene_type:complete
MPKLSHWTDTVPLLGLLTVAFFAGCLTGRKFVDVDWETLLTGILAVGAGAFALGAARIQISHQKAERRSQIEREELLDHTNFLQDMEIFILELKNTCKHVLNSKDKEIQADLLEQYYEIFFPNSMPLKPATTNEDISFRYNQIRLGYRMLNRQLATVAVLKTSICKQESFQASLHKNAGTLHKVCAQFPKSDLVFPIEEENNRKEKYKA